MWKGLTLQYSWPGNCLPFNHLIQSVSKLVNCNIATLSLISCMTYVCLFHSGCLASHLLIKIFTQAYCNHQCWVYSRVTVWLFCWWNPNIKVKSTLCPKNKQKTSWAYISCPKMALVATICLTAKYSKNTMKLKNVTKQHMSNLQDKINPPIHI